MPTLERSIVIEAPIDEVFKYAADWRTWPDWYDGFTDVAPMTEVEVRESEGRGLGVFATRLFAGGERIRVVNIDREVTEEQPLGPEENPEHAFLSDGRLLLVGVPDRYLNHSCDPNAFVRYRGTAIDLMARRAIGPGEEITVDYLINNAGGDSWECRCGSQRCRGETAASFFELPIDIQCEYYPLLAPWFLRQHTAQLAGVREALGAVDGGGG